VEVVPDAVRGDSFASWRVVQIVYASRRCHAGRVTERQSIGFGIEQVTGDPYSDAVEARVKPIQSRVSGRSQENVQR